MLKTRIKQRAARAERTVVRLADIEASIAALVDEDLLDLADIFSGQPQTVLAELATAEMGKRNLTA
jgi:hypothetical protein